MKGVLAMRLQAADPKTLAGEFLQAFGNQNALLTAGDRERCNTMTIGWCQLGRLWNLPVCTVYVRPERYTYQFMESHDYFSVCVLPDGEACKQTMSLCGAQSGRLADKVRECGLTLRYGAGDAPLFEEAALALVCKKLFVQDMAPACVTAGEDKILPYYGKKGGWHRIYTGEVVEAYTAIKN